MSQFTKAQLDPIIARCLCAADLLTKAADARHLCETQGSDDLNSIHAHAADSASFAKEASAELFALSRESGALMVGIDESAFVGWSDPNRVRKLHVLSGFARARSGGTPSIDWGHAAELRFFADTLSRCYIA
jgi:hypothetical protein